MPSHLRSLAVRPPLLYRNCIERFHVGDAFETALEGMPVFLVDASERNPGDRLPTTSSALSAERSATKVKQMS
jgi:hypothetical protein